MEETGRAAGVTDSLEIEEFSLADYYLVRGNSFRFKIYPYKKKRGKRTEEIGNSIYEYTASENRVSFGLDSGQNRAMLDNHTKLRTILTFVAALLHTTLEDICNLKRLASLIGASPDSNLSIFSLLRRLSK